ncbi:MAG: hypothetical protein HY661_14295 [Betaproteobacteria bacterium]|nr:hypothetical protein [Betaproteobacteria bacterium]
MEIVTNSMEIVRRLLFRISPYVVVEIVLPGGTLLALLFYLYRRRTPSIGSDAPFQLDGGRHHEISVPDLR